MLDRMHNDSDIGLMKIRNRNFSDNCAAAECFIRLSRALGDDSYKAIVENIINDLGSVYKGYSITAAPYAGVIEMYRETAKEVV